MRIGSAALVTGLPATPPESPDLTLLAAVEEASNDDGWAFASDVRFEYDGVSSAAGIWARRLWDHEALGLLESRPISPTQFVWGLTEAGSASKSASSCSR